MAGRVYTEYGTAFKGYSFGGDVQNERMRDKGRSRPGREIAAAALVLFLIFSVSAALSATLFFKLSAIEIINTSVYSDEMIIETSSLREGINLFTVNGAEIKEAVRENLPYIKTVKVTLYMQH